MTALKKTVASVGNDSDSDDDIMGIDDPFTEAEYKAEIRDYICSPKSSKILAEADISGICLDMRSVKYLVELGLAHLMSA